MSTKKRFFEWLPLPPYKFSIHSKIIGVLATSLLVMGSANVIFTINVWESLSRDLSQTQYWDLAEELETRLQPGLSKNLDTEHISRVLYDFGVSHPFVDAYLLDQKGQILLSVPERRFLDETSVDTGPILEATTEFTPRIPLLGHNPHDSSEQIFSVAPTVIEGKQGYVYLILNNTFARSLTKVEGQYYVLRYAAYTLSLGMLAAFLVGLLLSWRLNIKILELMRAVRSIRAGNLSARADLHGNDEIAELSSAINAMADEIQSSVEQIEHADNLRRALIAGVSHDLRSPMMIIEGYVDLLSDNEVVLDELQRNEYLTSIKRNTRLQKKLITDLFELSKLEANEKQPNKERFSLGDLCSDIVSERKEQTDKKSQILSIEFDDHLPDAFADIVMVSRVLGNLLDNAIRYSGEGSRILLRLEEQEEEIVVRVSDNGPGVSKDDLSRIFDSFYRANQSRTNVEDGSGLGLAIVKSIVNSHGKEIHAESSLGEGFSVTFSLDIAHNIVSE